MTNGFGAMHSYAARVAPRDRWAIAAYIRVLQVSRSATVNDVPRSKIALRRQSNEGTVVSTGNIAIVAGLVGLILSAVGWMFDPGQFYRSYLVSYLLWLGIALGCISLLMIFHMTGGNWGLMTRRPLRIRLPNDPADARALIPVLIRDSSSLYMESGG